MKEIPEKIVSTAFFVCLFVCMFRRILNYQLFKAHWITNGFGEIVRLIVQLIQFTNCIADVLYIFHALWYVIHWLLYTLSILFVILVVLLVRWKICLVSNLFNNCKWLLICMAQLLLGRSKLLYHNLVWTLNDQHWTCWLQWIYYLRAKRNVDHIGCGMTIQFSIHSDLNQSFFIFCASLKMGLNEVLHL